MSTPFLGQIEIFSFVFAPRGWALCNGQLMPINQNQALFSLLGTMYGGDGRVTFALPDLRGRVPISQGNGFDIGTNGGEESHTVTVPEMPQHTHQMMADSTSGTVDSPAGNTVLGQGNGAAVPGSPFDMLIYSNQTANGTLAAGSITNTGGSQPHTNIMPYLCLSMCIALQGIFPSQT